MLESRDIALTIEPRVEPRLGELLPLVELDSLACQIVEEIELLMDAHRKLCVCILDLDQEPKYLLRGLEVHLAEVRPVGIEPEGPARLIGVYDDETASSIDATSWLPDGADGQEPRRSTRPC